MKQFFSFIIGILLIVFCSSWGFFAHYRINRLAVFTLPKAMKVFYECNIDYLTQHAVTADRRRYVDPAEASKHFLNADHYGKKPFNAIPQNWYDAAIKYSADTLDKYGTVPWTIEYNYYRLVKAFKEHDTTAILSTSANLGHYIADAHVPLHLTQNYNGQLTNQTGIHALWESRLPELFFGSYNLNAGKGRYIENPLKEAFKICRSSFNSVDSVLRMERVLNKSFTERTKYSVDFRAKKQVKDYSIAYARAYNKMLNGMVMRRMRSSILAIGSYWYSAWIDAGQPDLNKLIKNPLTENQRKSLLNEEFLFHKNRLKVLVK